MNITYKEYKEKLKIELNEFKEKLKLKLDEFKSKQNKKLENFKLKNSKKNNRSSKRKIKGGHLSDEEIDIILDKYITLLNKINELKISPDKLEEKSTIEIIRSELINIDSRLLLKLDKNDLIKINDKSNSLFLKYYNNDTRQIILIVRVYSLFNEILLNIKQEQEFYDYNMKRTTKEEFGGGKRKSKFFHK